MLPTDREKNILDLDEVHKFDSVDATFAALKGIMKFKAFGAKVKASNQNGSGQ